MTPNWDFLLDEALLASILPAEYVHFARPIRDGLNVFLKGHSDSHQVSILRSQAKLPTTAPFSQRLGMLAQSCPVLQKLGQILARDQRLSPELRRYLRELESLPPSVPLESIQEILEQELGPLESRGVTLMPPAIAEASVAVVIPFRQTSRPSDEDSEVQGVFKILKPGIEQLLEQELNLLQQVGAYLDSRCDELDIPHLDYEDSFQQVRDHLWDEVQLENEQLHLVQAKVFFADEPQVKIPALLDHCTSRVTAMERIFGDKVTSHGLDRQRQKRRLAKLVAKALIAKPVFSKSDESLFHNDPHAGNLFFTDDGRLAILDWSLASTLGARERIAIVQIIRAMTLDAERIVAVLMQLGDRHRVDEEALKAIVEAWIKRVRRGQFPGLSWLVGMLDDAVQNARLRVAPELMLFRKSLHTLEGVVAEVGESSGQIDKTLSIEFLRHFAAEWPQRWVCPPSSRDFATRISNFDLTQTLLNYPATVARFWTGHAIDILEACVKRWETSLQAELPTSDESAPTNVGPATRIGQE